MVSTRSHDHALQVVGTNSQNRQSTSENPFKKRKLSHDEYDEGRENRRRNTTTETAVAVVIDQPRQDGNTKILPERSRSNVQGRQSLLADRPITIRSDLGHSADFLPGSGKEMQPIPQQNPHSLKESSPGNWATEEKDKSQNQPVPSPNVAASLELEAHIQEERLSTNEEKISARDNAQDDKASDDEAPEEAITTAMQDKIGAAAAKAAELSMKEEAARKVRRREHNDRMRFQVQTTKRGIPEREPGLHQSAADNIKEGTGHTLIGRDYKKQPLPAILPDEILSIESSIQHPAPPPIISQPQKNTRRKFFVERQDRPPKDLVRGNTKVRIIEPERTGLPPKSSTKGKEIREKWLLGQRGDRPGLWVPRMKQSSSFVRKAKR